MDTTNQIKIKKKKENNALGVENERMSEMVRKPNERMGEAVRKPNERMGEAVRKPNERMGEAVRKPNERMSEAVRKPNERMSSLTNNTQGHTKEGPTHQADQTKEPVSEETDRSEQVISSHRFPLHSDVSTPKSEIYEMELQKRCYENNPNGYHSFSTPISNANEKKGTKNALLQNVGSMKGTVLSNMNGDTLSSYTIYQGGGEEENVLKNSTGISENNSISVCSFHGGIISNDLQNGEFLRQGEIPQRGDNAKIGAYQNGITCSNIGHYPVKEAHLSGMHPEFCNRVKRSPVCTYPQGGDKLQPNGHTAEKFDPVHKEQLAKQISGNMVDAKNGFSKNSLVTQQGKWNANDGSNICEQKWHFRNGNSFVKRSDVNGHEHLRAAQWSPAVDYTSGANNLFSAHPKSASPQGVSFYIGNTHGRSATPGGDSPGGSSPGRSALLLKGATTCNPPRGNYHLQGAVGSHAINTAQQWDSGKRTMGHTQCSPNHSGAHPSSNGKVKNAKLNEANVELHRKKNQKVFVKNTLLSDGNNSRKNCVVKNALGGGSPGRFLHKKNGSNVLKFVIPVGSLTRGSSPNGGVKQSHWYPNGEEEQEREKKKRCKLDGGDQINSSAAPTTHGVERRSDGSGQTAQPACGSKEGGSDAEGGSFRYVLPGKTKQSNPLGQIEQLSHAPPSARRPPSRGYHAKKGNLTYSGLLTSMVSSILTQQNERQSQEENCFSYAWKGSDYDYSLLRQMEDGTGGEKKEQEENKDQSDYQISSKIIQQLRSKATNERILQLTLTLMICISVLCNYDHGAIPVTLEEIQKDFPLSYIEQSLLGSLVYFGLIIGTIIASVLFELLTAKFLISVSTLLLSISLYIFSHANCVTFMYISRFINGLCQAIPVVYLPVWVDEFSPHEKATQWMSYIQLASIGGTVFGYFLGGILSNSSYSYGRKNSPLSNDAFVTTWRSPFLIQAFLLLPLFLIMLFIPSDMINISSGGSAPSECEEEGLPEGGAHAVGAYERCVSGEHRMRGDHRIRGERRTENTPRESPTLAKCHPLVPEPTNYTLERGKSRSTSRLYYGASSNSLRRNFNRSATYIMERKTNVLRKTFKEVKKLLNNKLYIIITLGMSNLYFVVTGIQFWITEYMSVVLLTEKMKIITVSTLCFLTSPTSGVWFGGFVCDLFGGYKNTNYSRTIKVATAFAISACIFGILSAHLNNFVFFSVSLWLCLFTGSALVPVAVGMLLSCVNNHQKSLSSAVSQVIYNVFGWFSAPLLSGIIMDIMHKYTNDNRLALKAGFTMILYSSFIGFLLLFYANFLDFSDRKDNDETIELEEPLT
ncbi:sugar transporter, putative [Plasmodium vivax]|uniref:Major facilitator superfamily (MFS) profile domain-containing protein n=2 Tax=Plasmodium vivax TaxID=5855 RepID=A0A0J9SGX5_PLAVI|nr:hypothetical protein PVIIG_04814 [Plasmodium vivax India VII]CAG9480507.1 unnamed protein product [Plasmodium vivax]SCO71916.1 sugar transporter, putative [Plasmodium vivax]